MFSISKRMKKGKNYDYSIIMNNEDLGIVLNRMVTIEEKIISLLKTNNFSFRTGYFSKGQKGFNSFFMNYEVDVVFIDKNGKIIESISSFKTNKISKYYEDAHTCLVFPKNTINYFNINIGSYVQIEKNKKLQ